MTVVATVTAVIKILMVVIGFATDPGKQNEDKMQRRRFSNLARAAVSQLIPQSSFKLPSPRPHPSRIAPDHPRNKQAPISSSSIIKTHEMIAVLTRLMITLLVDCDVDCTGPRKPRMPVLALPPRGRSQVKQETWGSRYLRLRNKCSESFNSSTSSILVAVR